MRFGYFMRERERVEEGNERLVAAVLRWRIDGSSAAGRKESSPMVRKGWR